MLFHLLSPLHKTFSAFNVFRYLTFRTALAVLTALVVSFALGPGLIRRLRQFQIVKHGMPVPIAGNSREWKHGENVRLFDKQGMLIGVGIADLASKTVKIKRLINH